MQQYGINTTLAVKIYKTYGQEIYGILKENPYRMADDVEGVGFRTADEIASRVGIRTDSDFRIRSGIQYVLLQAAGEGHTYLPMQELTQRASRLLEVDPEHIEQHYMNLAMDRKIIMRQVEDSTQIYAATYFYMEANTATRLTQLNAVFDVPDIEIEDRIRKIEKKTGMDLDEHQVEAVKEAVRNGVLVITGGPGTGKTTTINTIIRYFELSGEDIMLAAAAVIGGLFAILLFTVLPTVLVGGLNHLVPLGRWAKVVLEAVLKVAIFLTYMAAISRMKEIHRVFEYHGAEHKTIACYEAGDPLTVENVRKYTRFHPRCGTSFLILVVIVSVFLYSVLPWSSTSLRVVFKLLLLPLVMGISYELLKWCGRSDNIATRIIRQPGLWVQRLTVFEPDDSMIEVAIAAVTPVLPEDPEDGKW